MNSIIELTQNTIVRVIAGAIAISTVIYLALDLLATSCGL